jgi:hypothetical protein
MPADVAASIRSKVRSRTLPLPADPPGKCYVGMGTSRPCDACDEVIAPDQREYELDIADDGTLRFHADCLAAWHELRAERLTE